MRARSTQGRGRMPGASLPARSIGLGIAAGILVLCGAGHRILARQIGEMLNEYLQPRQPLASMPLQIGSWNGRDLAMDEPTRRLAGDDDFINREYVDAGSGRTAGVYVGYIGRPRSRMGHRPDVCYPAHGYREVSRRAIDLRISESETLPALLFEFAPPGLGGSPLLVLATYAINGRWVNDTRAANAYNVRGPSLFSRQLAYVVRVQVSLAASGDERADLERLSGFVAQVVTHVQDLLPQ